MRKDETLELRRFLAIIRRWAWLIVGCAVLAMIIAFGITTRMPPTYEATTTLLVAPAEQLVTSDYNTLMAGERLALTYGQMLEERSTLQAVIARLEMVETPETLAKRIRIEPVKDTQLVRVKTRDPSPTRAALIANTIADVFTAYARTLQEDRYRNYILDKEAKVEAQRKLVEETQSAIEAVGKDRVSDETELTQLQGLLANYRDSYRTLQQDQQSLQQLMEGVQGQVKIVEMARGPTAGPWRPEAQPTRPTPTPTVEVWTPFAMQFAPKPEPQGIYTATVTLLVDQSPASQGVDYSGILASERLAGTYAQIATGPSILAQAIARLGNGQNPDTFAMKVNAEPIPGTQLLKLQVTGDDVLRTTRLANLLAQVFVEQIRSMLWKPYSGRLADMEAENARLSALIDETQAKILTRTATRLQNESELARLQSMLTEYRNDFRTLQQEYEQLRLTAAQASGTIVVTERAQEPLKPVRDRVQYILLAALVAILVASGIAFLLDYLDESIKTPEDVSHVLSLNTIGMIERFGKDKGELIVTSQPQAPAAEAFRLLAANIRLASQDNLPRSILVTSPASGEGKSVVTVNLAVAMASVGLRVTVVDADLRLPRLHQLFGLSQAPGLTDALAQGKADGQLKPAGVDGVKVLTAGTLPPDPVVVLSSPQVKQLLADLMNEGDLVIIDSPPVLPMADATILAAGVDDVLLLLQAGHTRGQPTRQAVEALRQVRAHLIGVVLNAAPARSDEYYRYYHARSKKPGPRSQLTQAPGTAARLSRESGLQ